MPLEGLEGQMGHGGGQEEAGDQKIARDLGEFTWELGLAFPIQKPHFLVGGGRSGLE